MEILETQLKFKSEKAAKAFAKNFVKIIDCKAYVTSLEINERINSYWVIIRNKEAKHLELIECEAILKIYQSEKRK